MHDWNEIDRAAMQEGEAIKKSFRRQRPRKPRGINREDVKHETKKDLLSSLGAIGGKTYAQKGL